MGAECLPVTREKRSKVYINEMEIDMWTVVYMAQSKEVAESVQHLLEKNDLIVKMRSIRGEDEGSSACCELLVPESEVQQALSLIIDANF